MNHIRRGPKKGSARKWSEKLKRLREQRPSKELVEIINQKEKPEKVAAPLKPSDALDI